jgi:hypothetical protein
MAIVNSLAIGAAKNSIGQITYSTVKGRTIGRQKPVHVSNPRTPRQVAQREKMANIVAAWRTFFFQTRPYWTVIKGYGSAYNEFVSKNMPLADQITVENNEIKDIPEGIYCSSGKYGDTAIWAGLAGEDELEIRIRDMQLQEELALGDELVFVLCDPTGLYPTEVDRVVLTETQIEELKQGEKSRVFMYPEKYYAGIIYYSSARGVSSTARLKYYEALP